MFTHLKIRSQPCPPDFWKSTPGRAAREALVKVQLVPLAAKKVEERPLLKEVKEDASRRQQQMLKEGEEKENRVGGKEECVCGKGCVRLMAHLSNNRWHLLENFKFI